MLLRVQAPLACGAYMAHTWPVPSRGRVEEAWSVATSTKRERDRYFVNGSIPSRTPQAETILVASQGLESLLLDRPGGWPRSIDGG